MNSNNTSLCESCQWKRDIISGRGSRFLLCQRAADDAHYAKYPPQPIVRCSGHTPRDDGDAA